MSPLACTHPAYRPVAARLEFKPSRAFLVLAGLKLVIFYKRRIIMYGRANNVSAEVFPE